MLSNKIIVITGGAGLLGQEFSKSILKQNGVVVIADSNEKEGVTITKKLQKLFPSNNVEFQLLNIYNKQSILCLIDSIDGKYGKINALVNNAYPRNKNYGRKFEDVSYEDFCENISINLGGYFLTSQQFLSYFSNQGYGDIINISSIYGVVAPRFDVYNNTSMTMPIEYAAIKSALIHLTKYMAKYFRMKNIRVNSISLGGILNDQPPTFIKEYKSYCLNKGMLDVSDISGTLIFLLSEYSQFINGQNIIVDDGFTI